MIAPLFITIPVNSLVLKPTNENELYLPIDLVGL
jgi:hypothetical protein